MCVILFRNFLFISHCNRYSRAPRGARAPAQKSCGPRQALPAPAQPPEDTSRIALNHPHSQRIHAHTRLSRAHRYKSCACAANAAQGTHDVLRVSHPPGGIAKPKSVKPILSAHVRGQESDARTNRTKRRKKSSPQTPRHAAPLWRRAHLQRKGLTRPSSRLDQAASSPRGPYRPHATAEPSRRVAPTRRS